MKKIVTIAASIVALFLIIAILAPFIVDLNKYKGSIKKVVEEQINGTFDVEDINLTVLSGLGANVSGVVIKNTDKFNNTELFKVDDIKIKVSIFAIFTGVSSVEVLIDSPTLQVIKSEQGELNVADILKKAIVVEKPKKAEEEDDTAAYFEDAKVEQPEIKKDATEKVKIEDKIEEREEASPLEKKLLSLIKKVKIDVAVGDASLAYEDKKTKIKTLIEDVDIELFNINLGEKFDFLVESSISIPSEEAKLDGDISITGNILMNLVKGQPEVRIEGVVDMTPLSVEIPNTLVKKSSEEMSLKFYLRLKNHKVKTTTNFTVQIAELLGEEFNEKMTVKTRLNSNLGVDYVPQYSDFSLNFMSKGSDLYTRVRVSGKQNVEFEIKSKYFKVDDFITPPPTLLDLLMSDKKPEDVAAEEKKADEEKAAEIAKASGETTEEKLPESIVDPFKDIKDDPMLLGLKVTGDIHFTRVIAVRTEFKNILSSMNLSKLKLFSTLTFNVFRGNFNIGQLIFNMRTRRPLFNVEAIILGIDLGLASKSLLGVENAAVGKIKKGDFELTGAGIDPITIKKTIRGPITMKGANIKIKSFNVLRELKSRLKEYSFLGKIDLSKQNFDEGIDVMKLDMALGGGKADINLFECWRKDQYLLQVKGYSTFEPELNLKGNLKIIPPLSRTVVRGKSAKRMFFNRLDEVVLPFYLKGPAANLTYGVDADKAQELYSKKVVDQAVVQTKKILKDKKVADKVINKIPPKHQEKAKKLFKKFGL